MTGLHGPQELAVGGAAERPLAWAVEALRQQALVAAVFGEPLDPIARLQERDERLRRGLSAYRANGQTLAERALAAAYPTTAAMIGADDFAALARALWRASPPTRGDLAHWGLDLPEFIEAQESLNAWPYLGDVARLDAAVLRCEAAADAALEAETLALLTQHDPAELQLQLQPSVQVLGSLWPLASIHAAHRAPSDEGFAAMRTAIDAAMDATTHPPADAAPAGREDAGFVVSRRGWRAEPQAIAAADHAWMQALCKGCTLDQALDAALAAGAFDFNTWLVQAMQQGWLWRACARSSATEENQDDPQLA